MLGDDAVPLVTAALPSLMVTYHWPPLSPERLNWIVEFMPLAASAFKLAGISLKISSGVMRAPPLGWGVDAGVLGHAYTRVKNMGEHARRAPHRNGCESIPAPVDIQRAPLAPPGSAHPWRPNGTRSQDSPGHGRRVRRTRSARHPRARDPRVRARSRDLVQRRRGRRPRRHGDQDRRPVPGVLARYRAAAPRDVSVPGEGPRALPHPRRGLLPAARGGGEAGAREGAVLLLQGWSQGVLRHPEGGAAGARAPSPEGVGDGPAPGPEPRHAGRGARRPARSVLRVARAPARQVQPARELVVEAGVGLHPRARGALQRSTRARLLLDRLRAVHAADQPRAARARGALVVGGGDAQGVRPARRQRAAPALKREKPSEASPSEARGPGRAATPHDSGRARG